MRWPTAAVDRRTGLIGGGAGVGLIVAFAAWPRRPGSPLRGGAGEQVFGPYLRIANDGRVTVAVPQAETGQGAWTGLAQVAADELGAAWEMVAVEPAPLAPGYKNSIVGDTRLTAQSSSIRAFEAPVREASAMARAMLCAAAAARWGVDASACEAQGGFVIHGGRRLGIGALAEEAAGMRAPNPSRRPPWMTKPPCASHALAATPHRPAAAMHSIARAIAAASRIGASNARIELDKAVSRVPPTMLLE